MATYKVIRGDATQPQGEGIKLIPHVNNDVGAWGAGFVLAISRRWKEPEKQYRQWYADGRKNGIRTMELGKVQFVNCTDDIIVANMIGQVDTAADVTGRPPIRYISLAKAMMRVHDFIKDSAPVRATPISIHAPKFGSALAGGEWKVIEAFIHEIWVDRGIDVTIYEYP